VTTTIRARDLLRYPEGAASPWYTPTPAGGTRLRLVDGGTAVVVRVNDESWRSFFSRPEISMIVFADGRPPVDWLRALPGATHAVALEPAPLYYDSGDGFRPHRRHAPGPPEFRLTVNADAVLLDDATRR
jgi:hypothetical protein